MRTIIRRKWQLLWAIGFLIPVFWSVRLLVGRPPVVRPSVETTFLTGEALPDGSLDFSAALRNRCNNPIPEEANAAIALRVLRVPAEPSGHLLALVRRASSHPRDLRSDIQTLGFLVQSQSLTADALKDVTEYLEEIDIWRKQWMSAIRRPQISKPPGMTIKRIRDVIETGAELCLLTALHQADSGQWNQIVELHEVVDRAADHLAGLQCGWLTVDAFNLHAQSSHSLRTLVLRHPTAVSAELREYIEKRMEWPIEERLSYALDNACRILQQTYVRKVRYPDTGDLQSLLGQAMLGNRETHAVQLRQLRNIIDWNAVARIQNDAVDDYVALAHNDGIFYQRGSEDLDQLKAVEERHGERAAFGQLIQELRQLNTSNISEGIGWQLATLRAQAFRDVFYRAQFAHVGRLGAFAAANSLKKAAPVVLGDSRDN